MNESKITAENHGSIADCINENSSQSENTKAFSKRLKEMTQKALEEFILKLNILNKEGELLKSPEEIEDFLKNARKKDNYYREREIIINNPDIRDIFIHGEKEISNYYNKNDVSLEQAFDHYISKNILSLISNAEEKAFEKALDSLNMNIAATPGSLSSHSGNLGNGVESMNEKDFEKLMKKALRGELKNKF